jgi:hypothetical protein
VWQPKIRTVWQLRRRSRLITFLRDPRKKITFTGVLLALCVFFILFYVYREETHDVLIIDPFTVPKRFDEAGLTSEVMANRIRDAPRQIEQDARTRTEEKDNFIYMADKGPMPNIEIPGTKIDVETAIDVSRAVFGKSPKHISGNIVFPVVGPTSAGNSSGKNQATVTIYVAQGRNRSRVVSVVMGG